MVVDRHIVPSFRRWVVKRELEVTHVSVCRLLLLLLLDAGSNIDHDWLLFVLNSLRWLGLRWLLIWLLRLHRLAQASLPDARGVYMLQDAFVGRIGAHLELLPLLMLGFLLGGLCGHVL